MEMFEITAQSWKAEDGRGGFYVVQHEMALGYCYAFHFVRGRGEPERLGQHDTPASAFSACMEHAQLALNDRAAAAVDDGQCSGRSEATALEKSAREFGEAFGKLARRAELFRRAGAGL